MSAPAENVSPAPVRITAHLDARSRCELIPQSHQHGVHLFSDDVSLFPGRFSVTMATAPLRSAPNGRDCRRHQVEAGLQVAVGMGSDSCLQTGGGIGRGDRRAESAASGCDSVLIPRAIPLAMNRAISCSMQVDGLLRRPRHRDGTSRHLKRKSCKRPLRRRSSSATGISTPVHPPASASTRTSRFKLLEITIRTATLTLRDSPAQDSSSGAGEEGPAIDRRCPRRNEDIQVT